MISTISNERFTMKNSSALFLLLVIGIATVSMGQQVWTQRNPLPSNDELYGIAYANGTYVMVGTGGTILSSNNGTAWTKQRSGTNQWLTSVVWGNNQFVACGFRGTILTSPDGVAWTNRVSGTKEVLWELKWNGTLFLAVGTNGTIITSSDGSSWVSRNSGVTGSIENVAYNNNTFVASGSFGGTITSPDGVSWSRGSADTTLVLGNLLWTNNQFVAIGSIGPLPRSSIYTSPDGLSWVRQISDTSIYINIIAWNGTTFIATGGVDQTHFFFTSIDGHNWSKTDSTNYLNILCTLWDGSRFIAGGYDGSIMLSSDGISWTQQELSGSTESLNDVTWGAATFVAVGRKGTIMTSPDGITWNYPASGTNEDLSAVVWAQNKFVVLGAHGTILASADGSAWANHSIDSSKNFDKAVWDNGRYVAVANSADSCRIITSLDALTWENSYSDTNHFLRGPYKCGSQLIVTGAWGAIITSANGTSWTKQVSGTHNYITAALWTGGQFVCYVMDSDNVSTKGYLTSPDAVVWTSHAYNLKFLTTIVVVENVSNSFIAGGGWSPLLNSTDGINWQEGLPGTSNTILGLADNGSTLVAVGYSGTIITSPYPSGVRTGNSISNKQRKLSLRNNIFSYTLDSPEQVIIKLYNSKGCLLQTLVNNKVAAGLHSVTVSSQLAFGEYVITMKTAGHETDESLLFVKSKR